MASYQSSLQNDESTQSIIRLLADLIIGCIVLGATVRASHSTNGAAFVAALGTVVLAAVVAGYLERSAKWAWIHPLLIMAPELIALPAAFFTCHGFECGGVIGFLIFASLFTIVLEGLSSPLSMSRAGSLDPIDPERGPRDNFSRIVGTAVGTAS